jgi:hypothetical protein
VGCHRAWAGSRAVCLARTGVLTGRGRRSGRCERAVYSFCKLESGWRQSQMTETEWNTCVDPLPMLRGFVSEPDRAELGVFGCACCRRVWTLLSDERLVRGVEVREEYERRRVSEEEMKGVAKAARIARREIRHWFNSETSFSEHSTEAAPGWAAGAAANAAVGNYHAASQLAAYARACAEGGDWQKSYEAERAAQCDLLRSIVPWPGNV